MRTHLDKICQIGLFKTASIWEVLACSLHRDLQTWYNRWVGLLAITRACVIPYLRPKPINLYFKKCITKPYQMGLVFYLSAILFISSDYNATAFKGNPTEQLNSVQPLLSCATVWEKVSSEKSCHHNQGHNQWGKPNNCPLPRTIPKTWVVAGYNIKLQSF